jgi:hypothetical protein
MATLWIHGGTIPPCPSCYAPSDDQLRESDGADRVRWRCLVCGHSRPPDPDWPDRLVPISDVELRKRNAMMRARVRARWRDSGPMVVAMPTVNGK